MKLNQLKQLPPPAPGFSHAQGMGTGGTSHPPFSFSRLRLENFKGDRNKMGGKKCEDCEKWQEEMYWTKFKVVHFFFVLKRDFRSQLKFPEKLVKKCLVNELADISVVTLKGSSGKTWTVELMRKGSDSDDDYEKLYLKKGWQVFVKEHNLKEHDMLLFMYKLGTSVFEVLMFDEANFCEKESPDSAMRRNWKNEGCRRSCKEGLNERKRVERESWLDVNGCRMSKGLKLNEKKRVEKQPSIEIIEPKRVHYKKRVITLSDDDEEDYGRVIVRPRLTYPLPGCKGDALVTVKPEQESEDDEVTPINPLALVLKTKSKNENNGAVEQAIREGKRRRTPHFVVCMKRTHISVTCFMTVPAKKARKFIAPETERVTLKMNGKTWIADYRWIKKGVNSGIRGLGWMDFVDENDIKIGDACLFEITSKKPVIFEVSIFRTDEDLM